MPVVYTPPFLPNSMYRPNLYVTYQPSADPLVLAIASIWINSLSVVITQMRKPPAYSVGAAPVNYYFEFDVAKILQSVSAPNPKALTTVFAKDLNISVNNLNIDCHTDTALAISYYYIDSTTGALTMLESGGSPVLDLIPLGNYSTIGTRQTLDYMGLDYYAIDYPTVGGVYDRLFLTNLPYVYPTAATKTDNPIPICNTDNLTISYIPTSGTNAIRVIAYDTTQTVISTAHYLSVTPNTTYTPRTIGIGLPQLAQSSFGDPLFNILLANLPTGYYYSIQAGNLVGAAFTLQSVKYMFKVVDCCANKVRLHWLNRLGGADAYTFTNKKTVLESSKSGLAQKPQIWNIGTPATYTFDKGMFKIQQTVTKQYEVESIFYDVSWGNWLAELLSSPEVYMETPSGLVSVVIEDSEIKIEETNELINVSIKFSESNQISVQQN